LGDGERGGFDLVTEQYQKAKGLVRVLKDGTVLNMVPDDVLERQRQTAGDVWLKDDDEDSASFFEGLGSDAGHDDDHDENRELEMGPSYPKGSQQPSKPSIESIAQLKPLRELHER